MSAIFSDIDDVKLVVNSFIDSVTDGEIGQRVDRVTKKANKLVRMTKSDIRQWKKQVNELLDDCRATAEKVESELNLIKDRGGETATKIDELFDYARKVIAETDTLKEMSLAFVDKFEKNDGLVGQFKEESSKLNKELESLKKNFTSMISGVRANGLKLNVDVF